MKRGRGQSEIKRHKGMDGMVRKGMWWHSQKSGGIEKDERCRGKLEMGAWR